MMNDSLKISEELLLLPKKDFDYILSKAHAICEYFGGVNSNAQFILDNYCKRNYTDRMKSWNDAKTTAKELSKILEKTLAIYDFGNAALVVDSFNMPSEIYGYPILVLEPNISSNPITDLYKCKKQILENFIGKNGINGIRMSAEELRIYYHGQGYLNVENMIRNIAAPFNVEFCQSEN